MNLEKLYEDFGYPSGARLFKIAKQSGLSVSHKEVNEFIQNQKVEQLHQKPKKPAKRHIVVPDRKLTYQMDLLDMSKFGHENKGFKWIYIMIDLFSRKAWAVALKNKETPTVLNGLNILLKQSGNPKVLHSDDGGEFKGAVKKYMKENNLIHVVNTVGDHRSLGIVDRFSQTIKVMLYKYMTQKATTKWLEVLGKFIDNYNKTVHSSLCGLTPNEADKYVFDTRLCSLNKIQNVDRFTIGDVVRVRNKTTKFERAFERRWSIKTYTIEEKQGQKYILSNGNKYNEDELQKVKDEDEEKEDKVETAKKDYKIEKELNREGIDQTNVIVGKRKR